MHSPIGRRSMLALSVAGALSAALPACSRGDEEPYDLTSYGYDPEIPEPATPEPPVRRGAVPAAASVRTEWLPPAGRQTMPNCFVWATVYGMATFYAARKSRTPPTSPARQAGADYAYIRYQIANNRAQNSCEGGQIVRCLNWLRTNGGTPSLAVAPNHGRRGSTSSCELNWTANHSARSEFPCPRT